MARKAADIITPDGESPDEDYTLVTTAPDDWAWDTHTDQSPTKVEFDTIGDVFVGQFVEVRTITPEKGDEPFDLLIFTGRDGNPYAVSPGYKLSRAFADMPAGTWCMITYVQALNTGAKEPMKDFKVQTRRM